MTSKQPYMAVQNLVPLRQVPQAMAVVLTVQTFGSSVWLIVANVIFNNSLHDLLLENASVIGLAPDFVIDAGARGVHSLGLSGAALQALPDSYAEGVDRVMYLGVGLAAGALAFCCGLGWHIFSRSRRRKRWWLRGRPVRLLRDKMLRKRSPKLSRLSAS